MGFFDGLLSGIPGGALISAGSNLIGGALGALGAGSAADTVSDAARKAQAQLEADKLAGLGFLDTGRQQASDLITPQMTQAPVMLPRYRGLTQQQQIGEGDLIRNSQAMLAASGLRGAGRAGVGSIMDADQRYQAAARGGNDAADLTALQTNRTAQNAAANNLAGIDVTTGQSKANTEVGVGSNIANSIQSAGNKEADLGVRGTGSLVSGITSAGGQIAGGSGFGTGFNMGASPNAGGPMYPGSSYDPALYQPQSNV